jgi:hypothetical protein
VNFLSLTEIVIILIWGLKFFRKYNTYISENAFNSHNSMNIYNQGKYNPQSKLLFSLIIETEKTDSDRV